MALNGIILQAKMLESTNGSVNLTQGATGKVNFGVNLGNFSTTEDINITATSKAINLTGSSLKFNTNDVLTSAQKNVANGIAGLDANTKLSAAQIPVDGTTLLYDSVNKVIKLATIKVNNTFTVSAITSDIPTTILAGEESKTISDIEVGDQIVLSVAAGGYAAGSVFIRKQTSTGKISDDFAQTTFDQNMDSMSQGSNNFFINAAQHAVVVELSQTGEDGSRVLSHDGAVVLKTVNVDTKYFNGNGTAGEGNAISIKSGAITADRLKNEAVALPSSWTISGGQITSGIVGVNYLPVASTTKGIVSIAAGSGLTVNNGALSLNLALAANSVLTGDGKAAATGLNLLYGTGLVRATKGADTGKLVVDTNTIATKTYVTEQISAIVSASVAPIDFTSADLVDSVLTVEAPILPKAIVKVTGTGESAVYSNLTPIFPDTMTAMDVDGNRTFTIDLSGFTLDGDWQVMF